MQVRKRRYKQFAGFPGANGIVGEDLHRPKPVPPLTEAEKSEMARLYIPHDPPQPSAYTPPPGPHVRRIGIELIGPLGLAAIVLFLFAWQMSIPSSGEQSYYSSLLNGEGLQAAEGGHDESGAH